MKRYLKTFFKNLKYLLSRNLYKTDPVDMVTIYDMCEWHLKKKYETGLDIRNAEDTITLLQSVPKSFCRFGDGEKDLLDGKNIPFQKYEPRLVELFEEILTQKHDNLYVGLNYYYYNDFSIFNDFTSEYYKIHSPQFAKFYADICCKENLYIDAGFNQIYQCYQAFDFETYYSKLKALFQGKDVVVFCGERVMTKLEYNLFEMANEVVYEYGPSKDAFSEFDMLLNRAMMHNQEKLLCFVLGPTSKALVYELSKRGYIAWDIGHMCKDYDSYMRRESRTRDNMSKFYAPD